MWRERIGGRPQQRACLQPIIQVPVACYRFGFRRCMKSCHLQKHDFLWSYKHFLKILSFSLSSFGRLVANSWNTDWGDKGNNFVPDQSALASHFFVGEMKFEERVIFLLSRLKPYLLKTFLDFCSWTWRRLGHVSSFKERVHVVTYTSRFC